MLSHIVIDALFVGAVSLIWFMLAYQTLLFFLGHRYYRDSRFTSGKGRLGRDEDLPAVSLLIPCHNEDRVLAGSLRATLALDYPREKLEILVINDGSTDRTREIASEFAVDPRIEVLDVPAALAARGKASALNYGLRRARHPVLAIYDADNTPEPGALRMLAAVLVADDGLGAVVGMYRAVNRRRNLLTSFLNIEGIAFQWIIQAGRWSFMGFTALPGTNYVVRRSLVESLGGWAEGALTEDAEMTLRVYQAGFRIKFVPQSVTWEQEPETVRVWLRQRNRWVRGHNQLLRKYLRSLLRLKPRRIGVELLYSLSLYYVFFAAIVVSDAIFLLGLTGLISLSVPGPFGPVWTFAYVTFVLQLVIALACEREESWRNIVLVMLMYFTYCQLWIPVVAGALIDDFVLRRPWKWVKTERFDVDAA